MADLKSVTVEYLRELARKHLGRGHSKLKTREDLLEALVGLVPGLGKLAGIEKPKAAKAAKGTRTAKESTPVKEPKAAKESKPAKEPKGARTTKESTPVKEPKAAKGQKVAKESKESAPVKKARSVKKQVQDKVKAVREKVRGSRKAPVAISAASRTEKPQEQPAPSAPVEKKRPLPGDDDEKTPVYHPPRPAEVVTFPPKPKSPTRPPVGEEKTLPPSLAEPVAAAPDAASTPAATSTPAVASEPLAPAVPTAPSEPAHPVQHAAEPLVEGFFVARMAGEHEVFRHHLSESQRQRPVESLGSPDYHERLGELSLDYADDTALLLARDPHTLFVLWDFSPAARQRALEGLQSPHAVLRVFDDKDILLRVIDVALESRSYYIHGLPPGHPYRVEVHFVGSNGRSRRIGHSSNRVTLPPVGPSSDTSVRFLRMPPLVRVKDLEVQAATAPTRTAPVEEREYITWRRVPLPGSGGFEDLPERHRERIGPGAPGEGASEQRAGFGGPGGGSSEQWAMPGGPAGGSSAQWAGLGGPGGGASEQWASAHPGGGASERWEWVWTRPSEGVSERRTWSTSPSGQGR